MRNGVHMGLVKAPCRERMVGWDGFASVGTFLAPGRLAFIRKHDLIDKPLMIGLFKLIPEEIG